jgi:hypothetical protein
MRTSHHGAKISNDRKLSDPDRIGVRCSAAWSGEVVMALNVLTRRKTNSLDLKTGQPRSIGQLTQISGTDKHGADLIVSHGHMTATRTSDENKQTLAATKTRATRLSQTEGWWADFHARDAA